LTSSDICQTTFFKTSCQASCRICTPPFNPGPQEPGFPACVPISPVTFAPPASPEAANRRILQEIENEIKDAIAALRAKLLLLNQRRSRSVFHTVLSLFMSRHAQNQDELTLLLENINTAQGDIVALGTGNAGIVVIKAILVEVKSFVKSLLDLTDRLHFSDVQAIQDIIDALVETAQSVDAVKDAINIPATTVPSTVVPSAKTSAGTVPTTGTVTAPTAGTGPTIDLVQVIAKPSTSFFGGNLADLLSSFNT
jgi:hypothetical protein